MAKQKQTGLSVLLTLNTKQFSRGLKQMSKKLSAVSKQMNQIGRSMSQSITAPLVAAGGFATKFAVDFEFAMAKVQAVGGFTADEMNNLEEQAKKLGASTSRSASEVASLQLELTKLGNSSTEIESMTESILSLSIAFDSELGETAQTVGATLNQFGLEASEAGRVADVMAAAFGGSALDLEKFREGMKTAGPVANEFGFSLEETTALLGTLADSSISGSDAGTKLKMALSNLAAEGGDVKTTFEGLIKGNITYREALDSLGKRAAILVPILGKNGEKLAELQEKLDNSAGAAGKARGVLEDTAQGGFDVMRSSIEALGISFGTVLLPVFEKVNNLITSVANILSNLTQTQKESLMKWVGIVSAIGPVLLILSKLSGLLSVVAGVLGGITAPVLLAVATIAAAAYLIYDNWEAIRVYFTEGDGANLFNNLKDKVQFALESIIGFFVTAVNFIQGLWARWGDTILSVAGFLFEKVALIFTDLFAALGSIFNIFSNLLAGDWAGLWTSVKAFFMRIATAILSVMQQLVMNVLVLWDALPWTEGSSADGFAEWSDGIINGMRDQAVEMEDLEKSAYDLGEAYQYVADKVNKVTGAIKIGLNGSGSGDSGTTETSTPANEVVSVESDAVDPTGWERMADAIKLFKNESMDLEGIFTSFTNSLSGAITGILQGTVSISEGLQEVVKSTIQALLAQAQAAMIAAAFKDAATTGIATAPLFLAAGAAILGGAVGAIPAFAEGGAVLGPTLALVGEKAGSRGEAIIPFEKMTEFAQKAINPNALGGGQNVTVSGRISGSDIVISNSRGSRSRSRF